MVPTYEDCRGEGISSQQLTAPYSEAHSLKHTHITHTVYVQVPEEVYSCTRS